MSSFILVDVIAKAAEMALVSSCWEASRQSDHQDDQLDVVLASEPSIMLQSGNGPAVWHLLSHLFSHSRDVEPVLWLWVCFLFIFF